MSDEHKAALAEGRNQGRAVRRYLEALDAHKPKRGRKRTPESMQKRLDRIDVELVSADPLKRLQLIQERLDLKQELDAAGQTVDLSGLEQEFVDAAAAYSKRKGISYAAWRELGVEPAVLKRAGISRCAADATAVRRRPRRRCTSSDRSSTVAVGGAEQRVARPLRVRHEPDDVATLVAHAGDVVDGPVGVVDVAHAPRDPRRGARRACRRRRCSCPRSG